MENAEKTQFFINIYNGRTLGFVEKEDVKYADDVSGVEGMTMVVCLTDGRNCKFSTPFMIFQNNERRYPIRGAPDVLDGVFYRTGSKRWMDTVVMTHCFSERREISPLQNGRRRVLYVDNCSGHNSTEDLMSSLQSINTELR